MTLFGIWCCRPHKPPDAIIILLPIEKLTTLNDSIYILTVSDYTEMFFKNQRKFNVYFLWIWMSFVSGFISFFVSIFFTWLHSSTILLQYKHEISAINSNFSWNNDKDGKVYQGGEKYVAKESNKYFIRFHTFKQKSKFIQWFLIFVTFFVYNVLIALPFILSLPLQCHHHSNLGSSLPSLCLAWIMCWNVSCSQSQAQS